MESFLYQASIYLGAAVVAVPIAARMGLVSASFVIEGYGALYALEHCEEKQSRLSKLLK